MLSVTLIDCGNGDSVLIKHVDDNGENHYALIDANDYKETASTLTFLTRYFQKEGVDIDAVKHVFRFVILSHAHVDHGRGLKRIMSKFGTGRFYYPKSAEWSSLSGLLSYANRSDNVEFHQAVDDRTPITGFGNVDIEVLWPAYDWIDEQDEDANENDNSVVLLLRYGSQSIVLPGDAEREVWSHVTPDIPPDTLFFKVPHHGSENGSLDTNGNPLWLNQCHDDVQLAISCHPPTYGHPHTPVIDLFSLQNRNYYRTDKNFHIIYTVGGSNPGIRYTR